MKKQILLTGLFATGLCLSFIVGCKKEDSDSIAPVVTITDGEIYYVQKGKSFIDPGATASDETDGTLTAKASGTVDANTVGTYTITYTAIDAAENKGTKTRTVYVVNFDGTYINVENCDQTGNNSGSSTLNASNTTANNGLTIGNFALSSNVVLASFTGNQINAGTQTIGSETYSWDGTITGTTNLVININYTAIVAGDTNTCSSTYTKQ